MTFEYVVDWVRQLKTNARLKNKLKKSKTSDTIGISMEGSVSYTENLDELQSITKETIVNEFNQIKSKQEVEFFFIGLADSTVNYVCRFWIKELGALNAVKAKNRALNKLQIAYENNDIELAMPVRSFQIVR